MNFKQAKKIVNQINNGEWSANDKFTQGGLNDFYEIRKNDVFIWVANGPRHFYIRTMQTYIEPPLYIKYYMWFFGISKFVRNEKNRLENEKQAKIYKQLFK